MDSRTPSRRWRFQYSLRTLVVASILVSGVMGWLANQRLLFTRELAGSRLLEEEFGCHVYTEPDRDGHTESRPYFDLSQLRHGRCYCPIDSVSFSDASFDRRAWSALHSLPHLHFLWMQYCELNAADETNLARLHSLRKLWIVEMRLNATDLAAIGRLSELKDLDLPILDGDTGNWSIEVARLTKLESLTISDTEISDESLSRIAGLTRLRDLDLGGCSFSSQGAKSLGRLSNLESLCLNSTNVKDEDLACLVSLPRLHSLFLYNTPISDDGMSAVGSLPHLRELWLADTAVTDTGLRHLVDLHDLKILDVSGTRVTSAGLRAAGLLDAWRRRQEGTGDSLTSESKAADESEGEGKRGGDGSH